MAAPCCVALRRIRLTPASASPAGRRLMAASRTSTSTNTFVLVPPRPVRQSTADLSSRTHASPDADLRQRAERVRSPGLFTRTTMASSVAAGAGTGDVVLASSVSSFSRPTTVLVHGLDSSKQTWTSVVADLQRDGYPAIAVDLRGHGESPLGEPSGFGPGALAGDVLRAIAAHGVSGPVVVVGHSMGGRVAVRLAADRPSAVAALVVEDMDVVPRPVPEGVTRNRSAAASRFRSDSARHFGTWEEARSALAAWYDEQRIEDWRGARIREAPGGSGWWSDVNPLAKTLAYETVLASDDGARAWDSLSSGSGPSFPVHLWVADKGMTVCETEGGVKGGIKDMQSQMAGVQVREWPGAAHSIHNTARQDFVKALKRIVDGCSLQTSLAGST